jgi:hypothetical protein
MKLTDLAYAAGAIDADGNITIKRTTQRMRTTGDCARACYSPRMSLGQVTPQVPEFLRKHFGGCVYITKPGTKNSRPLFKWMISDKTAASVCERIRPYLKIKTQQATAVMELQSLRLRRGERQLATWYAREHPGWKSEPLLTSAEVSALLGYSRPDCVSQAIENGTLLTTHRGAHGGSAIPRIPKGLVELLVAFKGKGRKSITAPQFVAAQHAIYERVRGLNKLGINGTCVNSRTGHCTPRG